MLFFSLTITLMANPPTEVAKLSGKELYEARCGGCHQSTGQGEDKWFPPLIETPWVQDETALVEILFRGVSGTIYVQNKRYASFMSPYGREISDEQLLLIIKYIREDLNSYEPTQSDIENIGEMRKRFNDSPPIRGNQELNSILTQSK